MSITLDRINEMSERLDSLNPTHLEIIDDSHLHAGHAGAETGMGHFTVVINSPLFEGKNLVEKHQLVYHALGDLMQTDIHALQISISNEQ